MGTQLAATSFRSTRTDAAMRAACLKEPGLMVCEAADRPRPGTGEVRVRLEGCGVCASNLPVFEGRPWFEYPLASGAPGHEGWGVIDELGPDVEGLKPGQRVACLTYRAFAEYDIAKATDVVPLPETLKNTPLPGEPLGCAFNVLARSDLRPGQTVAVIGVGFLGGVLVALAKQAGARVLAISRRPFALEMAEQLGADAVIPFETAAGSAAKVFELTGEGGCQRVIEAAGSQQAISLAEEIVAVRGRLIIAGYHQDGPRQVDMQQWNWRGIDVVNAHERDPAVYIEGMKRAVAAVADGTLDPSPLYTHRFPLEDLSTAMEMARKRPHGFMKALIINEA